MAGVVNLITRKPGLDGKLQGSIHTSLGSYGFQSYNVGINQGRGRWSYILSANTTKSDGDFVYTATHTADASKSKSHHRQNSNLNSKLLFGKANWNFNPSTRVQLLGELAKIDRGVPGSLTIPTVNGRQEDQSTRIHLDLETTPISTLNIRAGSHYHKHDLYWQWGCNPDLKPEKATNYEVGLRAGLPVADGFEFNAGYFNKNATDLIQWAEDQTSGKWTPKNVSAAQITGLEFSLSYRGLFRILNTEISYSRINSENHSGVAGIDGKKLPYRPRHNGSFVSSLNLGKTLLKFTARYVGERFVDESNLDKLDSHLLIDTDTDFGFRPEVAGFRFDFVVSFKNIFDKEYQVVQDYPMPGRLWRVKVGMEL